MKVKEIVDISFLRAGYPIKTITLEDCDINKALKYMEEIKPYVFTEKRNARNVIVKRKDFIWIETRDSIGCLWEIFLKSSRIAKWIEEQDKWIKKYNEQISKVK